jgi:hypothetical protein
MMRHVTSVVSFDVNTGRSATDFLQIGFPERSNRVQWAVTTNGLLVRRPKICPPTNVLLVHSTASTAERHIEVRRHAVSCGVSVGANTTQPNRPATNALLVSNFNFLAKIFVL